MRERSGAVVAWSAGVCAGAAALAGFAQHIRWLFIVAIVVTVVALVILVVAGAPDLVAWLRERVDGLATSRRKRPRSAFTELWRHTTNGHEAAGLMMMRQKGFSHPGYMRSTTEERSPFVRIGILVACDPLGEAPTTSDLRDNFLSFLRRPPIWNLVKGLTYVGDNLSWRSYASNGRFLNEAVLTYSDDQEEAPVAAAMMVLNEAGMPRYVHDSRYAELVLHIEPRDRDGNAAALAGFKVWYDDLIRALAVPMAFALFLNQDAQVSTYDDPPVQLGVQIEAYRSISELIDAGPLHPVAGSWQSNSFLGYMIADRDGKQSGDASLDLLRRVCDHALHLHGYESELASLRS
jgi:hypothetical protein